MGFESGQGHTDSWYAASSTLQLEQPQLAGEVNADVCVIGAGITGLSAALEPVSYTHLTLPTICSV